MEERSPFAPEEDTWNASSFPAPPSFQEFPQAAPSTYVPPSLPSQGYPSAQSASSDEAIIAKRPRIAEPQSVSYPSSEYVPPPPKAVVSSSSNDVEYTPPPLNPASSSLSNQYQSYPSYPASSFAPSSSYSSSYQPPPLPSAQHHQGYPPPQQHQQYHASSYQSQAPMLSGPAAYNYMSQTGSSIQKDVARHYNERVDQGVAVRYTSPIIKIRKFNNWVKSVLMSEFVRQNDRVLDLCCGKGGDLPKFGVAKIGRLVAVDHADQSLRDLVGRYHQLGSQGNCKFPITLICADSFGCRLAPVIERVLPGMQFDVVSSQFALHYSFESEPRARAMLLNVSEKLKAGGHFVCTLADANVLVAKLRATPGDAIEFGCEGYYKVVFDSKEVPRDQPFGVRYTFSLTDAISDCPEYLTPPRTLIRLANEYGLECTESLNFHAFYEKYIQKQQHQTLFYDKLKVLADDVAMTPEEWDTIYMYRVFVFQKKGTSPAGSNPAGFFDPALSEHDIIQADKVVSDAPSHQ